MQPKPPLLASQYQAALQDHLRAMPRADTQAARDLGKRALSLGLETLDLALLHTQALQALAQDAVKPSAKRSRAFFAEVMTPLEESRSTARMASAALKAQVATLSERSRQLAASKEELTRERHQRRTAEAHLQAMERSTQRLQESFRLMQAGLLQLSQRLFSIQESERQVISHELHAVVVSTLSGVLDRLTTLKAQTLADRKAFQRHIAEAQKQVVQSVEVVQRFARDLRPAVLDDLGLVAALQSLLKECRRRTGTRIRLVTTLRHDSLTSTQRLACYRVVQEALQNAMHHAGTCRITVRLCEREGQMILEIQDSGPGFAMHEAPTGDGCLGLLSMRQRVDMVGGQLTVASSVRFGTTIRATLPLSSPACSPPHHRLTLD